VADYDLAFANPTQSTMVQDRAGAADGTSSASGVTQVTPIEQVNTNKLSVGGTTPLVGIGLAAGSSPQEMLHIDGISPRIRLRDSDATGTPYSTIDASGGSVLISADVLDETASTEIGLATDGTTRLTIDSAGNVTQAAGVFTKTGTAGNVEIDSYGNTVSYTRDGANYLFANEGSGSSLQLQGQHSLQFTTGVGQTERLRIDSAGLATFSNGIAVTTGGIKFPEPQSASADANTLDDYEEGTFTPTITAAAGAVTTSSASGTYTKVGRMVNATFDITITTNGTGAGTLNSTLPFTGIATNSYATGREVAAIGFALTGTVTPSVVTWVKTSDDLYPAADGYRLKGSAVYQAA